MAGTVTTEVNKKQVGGAVNQRAIPRVGLYIHGTSRTQVLLRKRDRGAFEKEDIGLMQSLNFYLTGHLPLPLPPRKHESL